MTKAISMSLSTSLPTSVHVSPMTITRSEVRFVLVISLVVLVITSLPYVFGYATSPPDKQFMGLVINVPDHCQYFAWLEEFRSAHLISNTLTPEPNPPVFFNLLWWTLAQIGNLTGSSYPALYQFLRWVAGISFSLTLYGLCALIFDDRPRRRFAFLLTTFTSGLGWVLIVAKYTLTDGELLYPLDVYVAEGNTFLCILGYPHFILASAFILTVFGLVLIGQRQDQLRYAVAAGVIAQLLGWQHGYDLVIIYGVLGAYGLLVALRDRLWPRYLIKAGLIVGVLSIWPALYNVYLTTANPLWDEVLAQFGNAGVYSPKPLHMFILIGLPLIAAVITLVLRAFRRLKGYSRHTPLMRHELFVSIWFVAGWALNYVPTDFQIHMINSWQVPIGLLATAGVYRFVIPALEQRWSFSNAASRVATILLVLVIPTNLYLWTWRFYDLRRHDYPYYLHRDEVAALQWLDEQAASEAVVLSALETGRYVASVAGNRAFLGHWAQTVDFYGKRNMVEEFFAEGTDDARRQQILRQYNVDYVFYGPAEQALGSYMPDGSACLNRVFSTPQVEVYAAESSGSTSHGGSK